MHYIWKTMHPKEQREAIGLVHPSMRALFQQFLVSSAISAIRPQLHQDTKRNKISFCGFNENPSTCFKAPSSFTCVDRNSEIQAYVSELICSALAEGSKKGPSVVLFNLCSGCNFTFHTCGYCNYLPEKNTISPFFFFLKELKEHKITESLKKKLLFWSSFQKLRKIAFKEQHCLCATPQINPNRKKKWAWERSLTQQPAGKHFLPVSQYKLCSIY